LAAVISSAGLQIISAGASAQSTGVSAGGSEIILAGGVANLATISSGGLQVLSGMGTANATQILNGGEQIIFSAGLASGTNIFAGSEQIVSAGGTAIGAVVHGEEMISSGGTTESARILSGGVLDLTPGGSAAQLYIGSSGSLVLPGLDFVAGATASFNSATEILTITNNGLESQMQLAAYGGHGAQFTVTSASGGGTELTEHPPCFAQGTRISTLRGDVAVEALREGDQVMTLIANKPRRVAWIGHRHTAVARHVLPSSVRPVRIKRHAFAQNLPTDDLCLSPQHAILVPDQNAVPMLVPVRHLLNGATIVQEDVEHITYYHVELADNAGAKTHDVMHVHGIGAESFLDTGNRCAFENQDGPIRLFPDFERQIWQNTGCAELVQSGARLAPIRALLCARAAREFYQTTTEPDLHILTNFTRIDPILDDKAYHFRIPADAGRCWLTSRGFMPVQTLLNNDDERWLGVAVAKIKIDGKDQALNRGHFGDGWHDAERAWRWTNGMAEIPRCRALIVTLHRECKAVYWRDIDKEKARGFAPGPH